MPITDFKPEDWLPMPPDMGPPLPRFLVIYWPWYEERPPGTYRLTIFRVGNGTVTPGSGDYEAGTTITLTATPDTGAVFDHWEGDATGTNPTIDVLIDRDKEVTAHFIEPIGAEFRVSDLGISHAEAQVGYPVTISCLVTNIGAEAGDYTIKMRGDFMAEQSVTLQPGESKTISFEMTPTVAKSYSVSVDGLTGTFRAVSVPVADIRVEDLAIEPSEVFVGEKPLISVTAKNYGDKVGSRTIVCTVS